MQNIQIIFDSIFLTRPFLLLMFQCFISATIIKFIFYKFNNSKFKNFIFIPIIILFGYYFGLITSLKILFLLITLSLFNRKYINNWVVSFFILIELYIVLGLIFNPRISLITLAIIGIFLILSSFKKISTIKIDYLAVKKFIYNLNIIELFVIILCFAIGSMPQKQFDAVHANLYNAKIYINTNSLSPLPESVSSIFPQNAILYYTFFYQLGQEKGLQIAYLLPLIIILYCIKIIKIKPLFIAPLLITPIVIFEATSGYYDLLMASLILVAGTIIYKKTNKLKELFMAAFIIGFAGGGKYFPIFLSILPILLFLKTTSKRVIFVPLFFIIVFPLSLWMVRSYVATANPVFPFLQSIFPTPNIWDKNDVLENNPMIKTSMDLAKWSTGGFIYYPVVTYFKTSNFMEAIPKYPTIIYIILLPFQIFIFINIFYKIFRKKTLVAIDIILISLFISYYFTGFISRYYRYLWPTQFSLAIFSILYLQNMLKNKSKIYFIATLIFISIIPFNVYQTFNHLGTIYNLNSKLFQPDYFHTSTTLDNPITVINQLTNNNPNIKILDASKFMQGRFNFSPRVFQCNWYWYDKVLDIIKHKDDKNYGKQIIKQFTYIITNNPPDGGNNLCVAFLLPELTNHEKIYQDTYYQIYSTKKL